MIKELSAELMVSEGLVIAYLVVTALIAVMGVVALAKKMTDREEDA